MFGRGSGLLPQGKFVLKGFADGLLEAYGWWVY